MVPVRDIPKARTFIGTGLVETMGRLSISIWWLGDISGSTLNCHTLQLVMKIHLSRSGSQDALFAMMT